MAVNTAMNIIWATFDMLNQELYKSIPLNDSDSFANLWVKFHKYKNVYVFKG